MSSPLNLSLVGAAFATIGGMVYGGYELLKNEERPMSQLLEIRKRVPLNKDNDPEIGLQNGGEYIKAHTTIETEEGKLPENSPPETPKPKPTKKEVVNKNDVGGLLSGGGTETLKNETVPDGFKIRCAEESSKEHSGIGTTEYKNFEKYCTKPDPEND